MRPKYLASLSLALLSVAYAQNSQVTLTPGSKAPALTVAKFVKGTPVAKFEPNNTYVVEFWATWCGPCKQSIPHLTELQKEYKNKVTFIGVSVWENDQALVEPFVQEWGDKMNYTVAMDKQDTPTDRHGVMAGTWMDASGSNGIPTAFIVQDGKIQWIGHPMEIEGPLAKVVAHKWNVQAANNEFTAKQREMEKQMAGAKPLSKLRKAYTEAVKAKNFASAKAAIDAYAKDPNADPASTVYYRFRLANAQGDMTGAAAIARAAMKAEWADNPNMLNTVAWAIADPQSKTPKEQRDFDLAIDLAEQACKVTNNESGELMDTLAWAHYGKGNFKKAMEIETVALTKVEAASKGDLEKSLKVFTEAANKQ